MRPHRLHSRLHSRLHTALLLASAALLAASCSGTKGDKADDSRRDAMEMSEIYIDTMTLVSEPFRKQVVCNGRVSAAGKSDLRFLRDGVTVQLHVREGDHVAKGAVIASLDKEDCRREVEKAEHDLFRAEIELADKIIGLGYDPEKNDIPADLRRRAEVTSGYYTAKYQLETARRALADCDLRAPFAGRVANLDAKAFQKGDKVCTLIDDSAFDVEFKVLEAELENVRKGQNVKISPFIAEEREYTGTVTAINPQVDEKGLVKVTARMNRKDADVIDGLNVRVIAEQTVADMFVVPKDAVVERDGYHVIFRYKDGRAQWTYVDVLHSNLSSFAITGCARKETSVAEGDIVITSGNLNLADGTEVKLR